MNKADLGFGRNSPNRSVADILADSEALLKERPSKPTIQKYDDPYRQRVYFEFLTHESIPVGNLRNFYLNENGQLESNEEQYIIVHGHRADEGCFAPTICHVARWKPTGNLHPNFVKIVHQKWPNLKEEK